MKFTDGRNLVAELEAINYLIERTEQQIKDLTALKVLFESKGAKYAAYHIHFEIQYRQDWLEEYVGQKEMYEESLIDETEDA